MLRQVRNQLEQRREWHRKHNAAWSVVVEPCEDGLTNFQHQALEELSRSIGGVQLERTGVKETYLSGCLPNSDAVAFIYADGAQIHRGSKEIFWAEREDYLEPQELIQAFALAARAACNPTNHSSGRP